MDVGFVLSTRAFPGDSPRSEEATGRGGEGHAQK